MKTAEEILIKKIPYSNNGLDFYTPFVEAMKEYAKEVAQDALNRAGDHVISLIDDECTYIAKEDITKTEIILP